METLCKVVKDEFLHLHQTRGIGYWVDEMEGVHRKRRTEAIIREEGGDLVMKDTGKSKKVGTRKEREFREEIDRGEVKISEYLIS